MVISNGVKKYFIIFGLLLSPVLVGAINIDDFEINEVPSAYFFPQEFDKLVLDVTIPGPDNLSEITIKNNGTARDRNDITKFTLWKDAGEEGFQGMGKDEEIGTFEYNYDDIAWDLLGLNIVIPEQGLRIFISAEISKNLTTNRTIQIKISGSDIINPVSQTLRVFNSRDNLAPVSIIDDIETITTEDYTITGQSRDQGGSTPSWVKIEIEGTLYDVIDTGVNFSTWEYKWENIEEGTYTIKTQSADWLNNMEIEGDSIAVIVDFLEPEPPLEPSDPIENNGAGEGQTGQAELTLEEQLMVQIKDIQEQIINLLNQLIQIYLEELRILQ